VEIEKYLSGYCRQLDGSRMVEVVIEDGEITEIDCCYGNCIHQANCLIAKKVTELTNA